MPRRITPASSLDNLKKEARRWLKGLRAGDEEARARLDHAWPNGPPEPGLRDVQQALAREYGCDNWNALKLAVEQLATESSTRQSQPPFKASSVEECERLANDMVLAFDERDEAALQRLNAHYHRSFTFDDLWAEIWRRVYSFRQRAFKEPKTSLKLDEAQTVIAQDAGFPSWAALTHAVATGAPPVPAYAIDTKDNDRKWPDDGVPAFTQFQCNVAKDSGEIDLVIGAVQNATFADNAVPTVKLFDNVERYWDNVGNTWDGDDAPPPPKPPQEKC
jgi:hypothetical protein